MKKLELKFDEKILKCLGFAAISVFLVALLGSLFTDTQSQWYQDLVKPAIQPPNIVFPIVWTINYILVAITLFFSCYSGELKENKKLQWYYGISAVLNVLWSFVFFRLHSEGLAFFVILPLFIVSLLLYFELSKVNKWLKYVFLPYLIWIFYASVLNYVIVMLN